MSPVARGSEDRDRGFSGKVVRSGRRQAGGLPCDRKAGRDSPAKRRVAEPGAWQLSHFGGGAWALSRPQCARGSGRGAHPSQKDRGPSAPSSFPSRGPADSPLHPVSPPSGGSGGSFGRCSPSTEDAPRSGPQRRADLSPSTELAVRAARGGTRGAGQVPVCSQGGGGTGTSGPSKLEKQNSAVTHVLCCEERQGAGSRWKIVS